MYSNRTYFSDTRTGWIRMWADWPSLQPDGRLRSTTRASPGYANLMALDAQIRQACADGLSVLLLPYRHPLWANGTAVVGARTATPRSRSCTPTGCLRRRGTSTWRTGATRRSTSRRGGRSSTRCPDEGYRLDGAWSKFFDFLMRRYHWGQRASGRYVGGFELVNEPNLQLWPQRAPSIDAATRSPPSGALRVRGRSRRCWRPRRRSRRACGHSHDAARAVARRTPTIVGGSSRDYLGSSRPPCWMRAPRSATRRTPRQSWSHHNYSDVEGRTVAAARAACCATGCAGAGRGGRRSGAPNVLITEGGARPSRRMTDLYPGEDPLAAQAKCLQTAWDLGARGGGRASR